MHLVKLLLSRNFCQKYVGVNSRNFHTVFPSRKRKIFRQINLEFFHTLILEIFEFQVCSFDEMSFADCEVCFEVPHLIL